MQQVIGRKYKVLEMIGEGAFGVVVKGENVRTREEVAIKIENNNNKSFMLKNESKIYLLLNKEEQSSGFPNLRWFGKDEHFYYMATDLLGESLANQNDSLPLNIVMEIGVQIINRLRVVHGKGLIHRDIKPENFLFGLGRNSRTVHLIDFGFCKSYLDVNQVHTPVSSAMNMTGTPNFVSINAHDGLSVSRRDDIESAIYVLYYLFLPLNKWENIFRKGLTSGELRTIKKGLRELGSGLGAPSQMVELWKYCDQLEFKEEPNYSHIINIIAKSI